MRAAPSVVRLVTYNLHQGRDRRGRSVVDALADAVARLDPDVLACQESLAPADTGPVDAKTVDTAGNIATRLRAVGFADHRFAPNAVVRRGRLGNALVAREELCDHRNVDLSVGRHEPRGLQSARLSRSGLTIWNTHFGLTGAQRRRQWAILGERVAAEDPGRPLVICGDFNAWRGGFDRAASRIGLTNALDGVPRRARRTFPAWRPLFALDRVYVRGVRVRTARVLTGPPWDALSDHLPVEAELELELDAATGDDA